MGDGMQHTGDLRRVKIAKDNLSGCVVMLFASVAERESSCIKSLLTHSRQQSLARSERDRGHTPKTLILICGCCAAPVPLSRLLQYCTITSSSSLHLHVRTEAPVRCTLAGLHSAVQRSYGTTQRELSSLLACLQVGCLYRSRLQVGCVALRIGWLGRGYPCLCTGWLGCALTINKQLATCAGSSYVCGGR